MQRAYIVWLCVIFLTLSLFIVADAFAMRNRDELKSDLGLLPNKKRHLMRLWLERLAGHQGKNLSL